MKLIYQKNFKLIFSTFFVLIHLIIPLENLFSQELSTIQLENEFAKIDSMIAELQNRRVELSKAVQSYAKEIEQLKDKKQLNYFQHQRLEKLLKESQDLSDEIEKIDAELRALNKTYKETGQQLIRFYDAEINESLKNLEPKGVSSESRARLVQEIENQRAKREAVKRKIAVDELTDLRLLKIQIEPDDTPKQIAQKADLLKDQEDKLRSLAGHMTKQTKELQRELEIRTRIGELVTDLALFDQQEEAIGDVSSSSQLSLSNVPLEEASRAGFAESSKFLQENLLVGQKNFDFSNLPSEQLEDAIEILKEQQKRLQAQADSLAHQAEVFYKAAQDMKNQ